MRSHQAFASLTMAALLSITSTLTGKAAHTSEGVQLPKYVTARLTNGLTTILMERRQLPLISVGWLIRSAGAVADPEGREGVASITAQLLRKGTGSRTADQISETLDFVGATLSAGANQDFAYGSAEFMSKDAPLMLDLLSELLRDPVFPEAEVAKMLKQEIDGLAEDKEVPNRVLGRYFSGFLFGSHVYGRPVSGTETTLAGITRKDLRDFFGRAYSPEQAILVVVGDFKTAEMQTLLQKHFSSWRRGTAEPAVLANPKPVRGKRGLLVEKPDATQTFFSIGNVGLSRTNPDWVPLKVVNTLFGERFTSMINTELRIKSGLTYGARSAFDAHPVPGAFVISSFTKNDTTRQALELTLQVMSKLQTDGVTAEQLASSKAYIKGQFGPTLETNDQLARLLAELEFYGLGADYINGYFERIDAVTMGDCARLIKTYYPADDFAFVLIGKGEVIQAAGAKLSSELQTKSITAAGF